MSELTQPLYIKTQEPMCYDCPAPHACYHNGCERKKEPAAGHTEPNSKKPVEVSGLGNPAHAAAPTPETDLEVGNSFPSRDEYDREIIDADFARKLERERDALKDQRTRLLELVEHIVAELRGVK